MTDFSDQDKELARSLEPEWPEDEGITPAEPTIEEVEPVHLMANQVRGELRQSGMTDDEIDEWARAYFTDHSSGSADEFVEWIAHQQGAQAP